MEHGASSKEAAGDGKQKRLAFVIATLLVTSLVVVAGLALTAPPKEHNPFLTYPLHVTKFVVEEHPNGSYEFTVWVENQDYGSAHDGYITCMIINGTSGHAGFGGPHVTVGRGERHVYTAWTFENMTIFSNPTFDCQMNQ